MSSSTEHTGSIGNVSQTGIPDEVDVAIVGSGGAGLMAALTAAKEGARVLVVESREIVGGDHRDLCGCSMDPQPRLLDPGPEGERRP
jgi:flavin-dependent dehydrogenase